jgi:hypothetical protein
MSTVALDLAGHGGSATAVAPVASARRPRGWRLSRLTVGGLAGVLVAADMFWITSLHGAVGAIERLQTEPVERWLRGSLTALPFYVLAVWGALRLTQRLVGRRRESVRLGVALVLTVILTTLVGTGHASVTAYVDYQWQAEHLEQVHQDHELIGACVGLCWAKQETLDAHVKGVSYAAVLMGVTNLILGAWVLALRGGRLWQRRTPRRGAA